VRPEPLVSPEFVVPPRLETPQFVLEPLGPEHNYADYAAWSTSIEHIHGTPGWQESTWPRPMTLDENRADLERHASDFERVSPISTCPSGEPSAHGSTRSATSCSRGSWAPRCDLVQPGSTSASGRAGKRRSRLSTARRRSKSHAAGRRRLPRSLASAVSWCRSTGSSGRMRSTRVRRP